MVDVVTAVEDLYAALVVARLQPLDAWDPDEARKLYGSLVNPERRSVIRCAVARTGGLTQALATAHDRTLAVFQVRGRTSFGTRLTRSSVVHLGLAADEGFRSISAWCEACGDGHDLNLRWLKRAPRNAESDRTFGVLATPHVDLPDWVFEEPPEPGDPSRFHLEGDMPLGDDWYRNVAFARIIGELSAPLSVMAEWHRPLRYLAHFGNTAEDIERALPLYGDQSRFGQWEAADRLRELPTITEGSIRRLRGELNRP